MNLKLRPEWILTAQAREKALTKQHLARRTDLLQKSPPLKPLELNDVVQVQNKRGSHANKWDLSGTIVEVLDLVAYLIKMDSSGHITKRNRQFLRPIIPFNQRSQSQPPKPTLNNDLESHPKISSQSPTQLVNAANYHDSGPSADKAGGLQLHL